MAGAGYKLFVSGDVLTAAQVNTYLNEQTVMVFASSAARTSALSAVLAEGMMSYLQDSNTVFYYDGAAWNALASGDITAITAGNGITVTSGTGPVPTVEIDTAVTVDKTTAQTLTNKTLTSPALTTPTISTLTTNGDVLYGTGSGALSRLGIGSSAQVLTVSGGGVPSWATPAAGASGLTLITTGTITATTSLSVNNCFSATYDFYRIVLFTDSSASAAQLYLRMRVSGVDTTTSSYIRQNVEGDGATASAARSTDTGFPLCYQASSGYSSSTIDMLNPFLTKPSQIQSNNLGGTWLDLYYGAQTGSTSYDGFTIYASANFTGKVKVYGYQNS